MNDKNEIEKVQSEKKLTPMKKYMRYAIAVLAVFVVIGIAANLWKIALVLFIFSIVGYGSWSFIAPKLEEKKRKQAELASKEAAQIAAQKAKEEQDAQARALEAELERMKSNLQQ
jgi:hypothetical protein